MSGSSHGVREIHIEQVQDECPLIAKKFAVKPNLMPVRSA